MKNSLLFLMLGLSTAIASAEQLKDVFSGMALDTDNKIACDMALANAKREALQQSQSFVFSEFSLSQRTSSNNSDADINHLKDINITSYGNAKVIGKPVYDISLDQSTFQTTCTVEATLLVDTSPMLQELKKRIILQNKALALESAKLDADKTAVRLSDENRKKKAALLDNLALNHKAYEQLKRSLAKKTTFRSTVSTYCDASKDQCVDKLKTLVGKKIIDQLAIKYPLAKGHMVSPSAHIELPGKLQVEALDGTLKYSHSGIFKGIAKLSEDPYEDINYKLRSQLALLEGTHLEDIPKQKINLGCVNELIEGFQFLCIKGGSFKMGDQNDVGAVDELPVHPVVIRDFKMMATEVTVSQWKRCEASGDCRSIKTKYSDNFPIININWYDAEDFAGWLSKRLNREFRLPSEREWEYAARAGNSSAQFGHVKSESALCKYANIKDKAWGKANKSFWKTSKCNDGYSEMAPVKSFQENTWGVYDLIGNVWEWTYDCYSKNYESTPRNNQPHDEKMCKHRVLRGASWKESGLIPRVANRMAMSPMQGNKLYGFRLIEVLE